jgi:hypothetical protein
VVRLFQWERPKRAAVSRRAGVRPMRRVRRFWIQPRKKISSGTAMKKKVKRHAEAN